jgi:hypothetical protein
MKNKNEIHKKKMIYKKEDKTEIMATNLLRLKFADNN